MRKNDDDSQKPTTPDGAMSRSALNSFRALSNCLRKISSGASTVARSAVSAASSAVNRDTETLHDQVIWAGFDKLEKEDGNTRRVLLIAFQSRFQVWDVEETENIYVIVSANDAQASFLQMLPNPINSAILDDIFSETRPLLAVCGDSSLEENSDRKNTSENSGSETVVPTNVYVYSLKSQSYVHTLRFRSIIYTVRCSSRIVAVLQAAQIVCFSNTTLEMEFSIATNSITYGSLGVGYGPLAVGPRWIAYSGSRIANSFFSPELISVSSSPTVAQFARESSKHLASGIVNLQKFCAEVLPNPFIPGLKGIGVIYENVSDTDSIGMVIIKDIISKSVIAQFKAHKSPVSALCFDPSGMLLLTASIQGHNINVFRITPRGSAIRDVNKPSFVHLFRLQRGFTNAVIQDISFSNDSNLIVISSSRGTSHLFEINHETEVNSPVSLSASSRIRSGNISGWMGTMSSAASAAAGMVGGGSLPGAIASTFFFGDEQNNKKYCGSTSGNSSMRRNLLVFAPGNMTQYAVKANPNETAAMDFESGLESEGKLVVEPIQRWSINQNQTKKEMQDNYGDIYGGGRRVESKSKVYLENVRKEEWLKVTKKGKGRLEAELQTQQAFQLPIWAKKEFRFQEIVLDSSDGEGEGGEMEIEGIQTRERDLVPVCGYSHSPKSIKESLQSPLNITEGGESDGTESGFTFVNSPRNITQGGGEMASSSLESHGTEESLFTLVHSKQILRFEEVSSISDEEES